MGKAGKSLLDPATEEISGTEALPAKKIQKQIYRKIEDLYDFVSTGVPVMFVHDRDIRGFFCTDNTKIGIGPLLDTHKIYMMSQGFSMISIEKQKLANHTIKFTEVNAPDEIGTMSPITNPALGLDYFLDKMPTKIVGETTDAVLVLSYDPDIINDNNKITGTLRDHYNDMVMTIQRDIVKRRPNQHVNTRNSPTLHTSVGEYDPGSNDGTPESIPSRVVIILSSRPQLPPRLNGYCLNVGTIIRHLVSNTKGENRLPHSLTSSLTTTEILLAQRLYDTSADDAKVKRFRKAVFTSNNVIEDITDYPSMKDIGGYDNLKAFIETRKTLLDKYYNKMLERNLQIKGIFIAGVPGSGKTQILKALGSYWGLPAYRLRLEAVFGRYVGDSESALISALENLQKLSPCFVLLDEIKLSVSLAA